MNTGKGQFRLVILVVLGWLSHVSLEPVIAQTGPVSEPESACIAIDFYDTAHRVVSVTGQVQEHQTGPSYPDSWTGEINIPWLPEHDYATLPNIPPGSALDPIVMNSFLKDGLRLTGTSANGDAWVEFTLPRLPVGVSAPRVAPSEVFIFATAINARKWVCVGETLGVIDLQFEGGHIESHDLIIGSNIRNWWSGNASIDPGYVDFFTPGSEPEAREIDWGFVNGGFIGLDVARIVVPPPHSEEELVSIRVTAKPVTSWGFDVSVRLSGVTIFYNTPRLVFSMMDPPVSDADDLQPAMLSIFDHTDTLIPWNEYSGNSYSGVPIAYLHDPGDPDREVATNNSHFRRWPAIGPIPPGTWRIRSAGWTEPGRGQHDTWYPLQPLTPAVGMSDPPVDPADMADRNAKTFYMHGSNEVGTKGCIGIDPGWYDNSATNDTKFRYQLEHAPNAMLAMHAGTFKLDVEYSFVGAMDWFPYTARAPVVTYTVHSPVTLLVETRDAHVCGFDVSLSDIVNDIDGCTYNGPDGDPQILTYPLWTEQPSVDQVTLAPTGEGGSYQLEVAYQQADGSVVTALETGLALPGVPVNYFVRVAPDGIIIASDEDPPLFVGIEATPSAVTLESAGETQQLTLIGTYTDDATQDLTGGLSGTTYQSSDNAVTVVSDDGLVTAVGGGTATVIATNNGFFDTCEVTVLGEPANIPPVADDQTVIADEDTPVAITLTASDADGDTLTFSVVDPPSHGSLSGTAPDLTYTPDPGYSGADSFTFNANDGTDDSNTATVSITVGVQHSPTLLWSTPYSGQGKAYARGVVVGDGAIYVSGTTWVGTGPGDIFLVKYDLEGNAVWDDMWGGWDSEGGKGVAIFGNQVHVAGNSRTYAYDPVGDREGDAVTVKWIDHGSYATLDTTNSSDGWFTRFSGAAGYYGIDFAQDIALDAIGDFYVTGSSERAWRSRSAYVEKYESSGAKQWHEYYGTTGVWDICDSNGLDLLGNHVFAAGYRMIGLGDRQVVVFKYGTDGTPVWTDLWGEVTRNEEALDVAASPGEVYVTGQVGASSDPNGIDLLLLKLHDDGTSVSGSESTLFASPGDDIGQGIEVTEDHIYIVGSTDAGGRTDSLLVAYDVDLNFLWDYSWGGPGDDMAFDIAVDEGVIYVVGMEDSYTQAFVSAFSLGGEPTPPVADDQTVTTDEDTPVGITLTASDADGDPLTFAMVDSAVHGSLSGIAPDLTYTPDADYNGPDSFTFKANDGTDDSNIATVTITVNPVNDPPVADDQAVTTDEDTPVAITLTAADVDGDALTFGVVDLPSHGDLSGVAPDLIYTPDTGYNGPDSFTFSANDGTVDSNTATVSITVDPTHELAFYLDIKPGSCPNPLNRKSRGVLPVAVLGTEEFDVSAIDSTTLLLTRGGVEGGVPPIRANIEDVGTPFEGDLCDCHNLSADGFPDLALKFSTQEVVAALALGSIPGGEFVQLTITGNLDSGEPFMASDCVWFVPPNKAKVRIGRGR